MNGLVLVPGRHEPIAATVVWRNGLIEEIGPPDPGDLNGALGDIPVIDVAGSFVLPGIVDLHGDAFERCLMPRGGVPIDVDMALADNDTQLLAAGITTSFLSATDSWEPGLRSRDTLRALVDGLGRRRGGPDVRLHVRHERCNTEGFDELVDWLEQGIVALLSYNDHTVDRVSMTQMQRTGLDAETLAGVASAAIERRPLGLEQELVLSEVAERVGCVTASHDAGQEDDLQRDLALGVRIAEFPLSIPLAHQYRAEQIPVLLGAPNLVRGGSHIGNLSVSEALAAGAGDVLCSDYHYPSLLKAPFVAAEEGLCSLGEAWELVSGGAARAAGLTDRGAMEPGARADLIVVDPPADGPPRVEMAVVDGTPVLSTR